MSDKPLIIDEPVATGWLRSEYHGDQDKAKGYTLQARKVLGGMRSMYGVNDRIANGEGGGFYKQAVNLPDGTRIEALTNDGHDTIKIYASSSSESSSEKFTPEFPSTAFEGTPTSYAFTPEFPVETPEEKPIRLRNSVEMPTLWLSHTDGNAYEFDPGSKEFTGRIAIGLAEGDCYQMIAAYGYLFSLCHSGVGYGMVLRRSNIDNANVENSVDMTVSISAQDGFYNHLLLAFDGRVFAVIQCSSSFNGNAGNLLSIHQIDAETGDLLAIDTCDPSLFSTFLKNNNAGAPFAAVITRVVDGAARNMIMLPSSKESTSSGTQGLGTTPLYNYDEASGILYYDIDSREFSAEILPWAALEGGIRQQYTPGVGIPAYFQYPIQTQELLAYDRVYEPGGMTVDIDGDIWICTERRHSAVTDIGPVAGFTVVEQDWVDVESILLRKSRTEAPAESEIADNIERTFEFHLIGGYAYASTWTHPICTAASTDAHACMLVMDQDRSILKAISLSEGLVAAYELALLRTSQLTGTDDELYGLARDADYRYVFYSINPRTGEHLEHANSATDARYTRIAVHWDRFSDGNPEPTDETYAEFWDRRVTKTTNLLYL